MRRRGRFRLAAAAVACLAAAPARADGEGGASPPVKLRPAGKVMAGEKPIDVETGHAAPFVCDWDQDGKKDLLVGQFHGGFVHVFRNTGTDAEPRFESSELLKTRSGDTAKVPTG